MILKAIFFDFDGVIVDSMGLKFEAYCHALSHLTIDKQLIHTVQRERAGESRSDVLAAMYEQTQDSSASTRTLDLLVQRFTAFDEGSRDKMRVIPGTTEFLRHVSGRFYTAIITGTPQSVIERTISYLELDEYFDCICGTPPEKVLLLERQIHDNVFKTEECIFIGDGLTDQKAAQFCNVKFVGFGKETGSFDPEQTWLTVESLEELSRHSLFI